MCTMRVRERERVLELYCTQQRLYDTIKSEATKLHSRHTNKANLSSNALPESLPYRPYYLLEQLDNFNLTHHLRGEGDSIASPHPELQRQKKEALILVEEDYKI